MLRRCRVWPGSNAIESGKTTEMKHGNVRLAMFSCKRLFLFPWGLLVRSVQVLLMQQAYWWVPPMTPVEHHTWAAVFPADGEQKHQSLRGTFKGNLNVVINPQTRSASAAQRAFVFLYVHGPKLNFSCLNFHQQCTFIHQSDKAPSINACQRCRPENSRTCRES